MIAAEALKKFCSCVAVTEVFCEVRSARVRAISDTLRSDATPEENSTVPKNITSISGTMKANSVAARPLQSLARSKILRPLRSHMDEIVFIAFPSQQGAAGAVKGSFWNTAVPANSRRLPVRFAML